MPCWLPRGPERLGLKAPSMERAVELVSGPSKSAGLPLHGLFELTRLVHPPSGHCWALSQASADPTDD